MNYTIYKPNSKNSGSLASFRVSEQETSKGLVARLFVELVPQSGWDQTNKTGSFDNSKKKSIVFNAGEAGELLGCINFSYPWTSFHKSGEVSTSIKFNPWPKEVVIGKEGEVGFWKGTKTDFVLSVSSAGEKKSVVFSSGEIQVFKVLLENFVKLHLVLEGENNKKRFEESQKNK